MDAMIAALLQTGSRRSRRPAHPSGRATADGGAHRRSDGPVTARGVLRRVGGPAARSPRALVWTRLLLLGALPDKIEEFTCVIRTRPEGSADAEAIGHHPTSGRQLAALAAGGNFVQYGKKQGPMHGACGKCPLHTDAPGRTHLLLSPLGVPFVLHADTYVVGHGFQQLLAQLM